MSLTVLYGQWKLSAHQQQHAEQQQRVTIHLYKHHQPDEPRGYVTAWPAVAERLRTVCDQCSRRQNCGKLGGEVQSSVNGKSKQNQKFNHPPCRVASVQAPHLAELCSSLSRTSLSLSSSLSDLVGSPSLPSSAAVAAAAFEVSSEAVLTIEDLRAQLGSCFTCGVMWTDQQVSLDCSECGGYSLERPCMLCDGLCGQLWKRDSP
nr:uncharacterized protein LOC115259263 [Aedes albopictus]